MKEVLKLIESKDLWEGSKILKRDEFLKTSGTIDTNIYFIKSGAVRIFYIDTEEEHTIRFGYEQNLIVALDSFVTGKPSSLYIQALKKTEVHILSKSNFNTLLQSSVELMQKWNALLEQLILQQLERERDLLTSSPKARYEKVLNRSPKVFQEIPHKYIASYLRMTPETLSRLKKS